MTKTFELSDEDAEDATMLLTMFAQVCRAMRRHEQAEQIEELRNEMYAQIYSGS